MVLPQSPIFPQMPASDLRLVRRAVSEAERPAVAAALAQVAEQYNCGACDLEAFVMRMVTVSGRQAVIDSLDAVGYGSQARLGTAPARCLACVAALRICPAALASS